MKTATNKTNEKFLLTFSWKFLYIFAITDAISATLNENNKLRIFLIHPTWPRLLLFFSQGIFRCVTTTQELTSLNNFNVPYTRVIFFSTSFRRLFFLVVETIEICMLFDHTGNFRYVTISVCHKIKKNSMPTFQQIQLPHKIFIHFSSTRAKKNFSWSCQCVNSVKINIIFLI